MSVRLIIAKVAIKGYPVYTCAGCGAQGVGTTLRREFTQEFLRPEDVLPVLAVQHETITNNSMPAGWSGRGRGVHACPDCTLIPVRT